MGRNPERSTSGQEERSPPANRPLFRLLPNTGKERNHKGEKRIKLVRYISQEGACVGCRTEFQFSDLTLDRIKPGKAKGEYVLPNVQLMCRSCNNHKGANYDR